MSSSVDIRLLVVFYAPHRSLDTSPGPSHASRSLLVISIISFLSSLVTNLRRFFGRLMGEMFSPLPNARSGERERGRRPTMGVDFLSTTLSLMRLVWSF